MGIEKQPVKRSSIKKWVLLLLAFLLISLALLFIAFLTTHLIDCEYEEKVNGVPVMYSAHYGVWKVCVGIKGTDTVCSDNRGQGSPFESIYSQNVRLLSVIALCLYLPSIIAIGVLSMQGENFLLTLLAAITVSGSVGTGIAALSVFTHLVETSDAFNLVDVTYTWSYILGWIALGIILLIVMALLTCVIYCQCKIKDFEDYEDEVKLQMKSSTDRGLYNPAYVINADMSRSTIKDRDGLRAQPYQPYDENFHYKIEDGTFMQYGTEDKRFPGDRAVVQNNAYTNRKEVYTLPESFQSRDDSDNGQPIPRQVVTVDYGNTIEIRPRQIQPTPTFLDEDMRPDYVSDTDTRPLNDGSTGRTFTISRVRPTMEVAGTPLEVGDTYVVSLSE